MAVRCFNFLVLLLLFAAAKSQQLEDETCLADGTCSSSSNINEELVTEDNDDHDEDDVPSCTNDDPDCEWWAKLEPSECDVNPDYMHQFCRKACNVCQEPLDLGVVQNMYDDGENITKVEEILKKTKEYMENIVMVDPKYEKVKDHCKNKDPDCSYWAATGECEESAEYMHVNCAPACQTCEKLSYEERCPMDNLGPDAWGPGDLNKMFEKITTAEEYKQYEPRILSRPSYPDGESEENTDYQLGPWVVLLENFTSPEECERLIEMGRIEGYERSSDVGELNFDGTYEDDINEGRTSTNAWCEGPCQEDPMAQAVVKRIEDVTGIPEPNSEHLQLLKYEVGQEYQEHHDYIDFEVDQQMGVRLLTVYLYLNEVEAGGGTRFPKLDLTVQPKRGRALLWPSVLDHAPNEEDGRTKHQALPVIKGVKYGANAWVHQRDFKTPNENGC